MNEQFWENSFILVEKRSMQFPDFRHVGITNVKDIMQSNGSFYCVNEPNRTFNFNVNIIRLNSCIAMESTYLIGLFLKQFIS